MSYGLQRRATIWSALTVAALLTHVAARADLVTYSTSGPASTVLSVPGVGGSSVDVVTFTNQGSTNVSSTPADVLLGNLTWNQTNSAFLGAGSDTSPFNLTVTQTAPAPGGSGTYSGDLSASFSYGFLGFGASGNPELTFGNTSIQIGNQTYALELKTGLNHYSLITTSQASQGIDIPSGSNGLTLYAHLTSAAVAAPEPSTIPVILASALGGVGAWYRRKRSS